LLAHSAPAESLDGAGDALEAATPLDDDSLPAEACVLIVSPPLLDGAEQRAAARTRNDAAESVRKARTR
jgi:hypothetical protein